MAGYEVALNYNGVLSPNFFVEATLVRNGQVHQESRELFVPPSKTAVANISPTTTIEIVAEVYCVRPRE